MNKAFRVIAYLGKIFISVLLVAALSACGFFVSMNASNLYVLVTDGFKARADYMLYGTRQAELEKYFTPYYLSVGDYIEGRKTYSQYTVYSYGEELQNTSLWAWPWQQEKVVYVNEALYSIYGEIDPAVMSREEATLAGKLNPPAKTGSRYKVTIRKTAGGWLIDTIERVGDFSYSPPTQQTVPAEILASLRPTATPVPSPTPAPSGVATPTPAPTQAPRDAFINTHNKVSSVNIRTGPGTSYQVLDALANNTPLLVYAEENGWYKVKAGSLEGYVSKNYVSFEDG